MSEVKWIKIVTDIFDDEKILLIESMPDADSLIVIWFKLLCLAGKNNNNGVFLLNDRIHYTDEMFATIFRRNLNTVRLALKTFQQFGMIEIINNTVTIPNWEKHQQLDALEMAREATRKRVARHREKQKLLASGNATGNVTQPVTECVTVTPGNADRIDKNRLDKNREEDNSPRKRFTPPTLDDLRAYATEKGYTRFNCEAFEAYYASKGWMVGKSPMKDWKAAVRGWVARDKQDEPAEPQNHAPAFKDLPREEQERRQRAFEDAYWAKKNAQKSGD